MWPTEARALAAAVAVEVHIVSADGAERWLQLVGPTLTVGRARGATVLLEHDDVSRRHAEIEVTPDGLMLVDLSTNGTYVDGRRVRGRTRLGLGAPVLVGPFTLRVSLLSPDAVAKDISVDEWARAATTPAQDAITPLLPVASPSGRDRRDDDGPDPLKRWLHERLLAARQRLAPRPVEPADQAPLPNIQELVEALLDEHAVELPPGLDRRRLCKEIADEALGLGPLADLLAEPDVSAVMVLRRQTIYVERSGQLQRTDARFSSEEALRAAIERLVAPLGRRLDEATPMVDARLPDGTRVNAILPPLAQRGATVTIRKRAGKQLTLADLIGLGSLDARMARFLVRSVRARRNILVTGGMGSGKTTLLNVLSSAISTEERIVTIEEAVELGLDQPNVVALVAGPAMMACAPRDLLRHALCARPDRIIVGECHGGEALDLVQAIDSGYDGALTTLHAHSPAAAIAQLETLMRMGGVELSTRAIRDMIARSIHLVVHQARLGDGSRKITAIAEVVGLDDNGAVRLESIFELHRPPRGQGGGEHRATGYLPSYLGELVTLGLCQDGEDW
jgi:pilus assembly protein CpaF